MTAPAVTATMPVRRPVLLAATVTDTVATGLILPVLPFIALKLGVPRVRDRPEVEPGPGRPAGAAPAESDEPDVVVAGERVAP